MSLNRNATDLCIDISSGQVLAKIPDLRSNLEVHKNCLLDTYCPLMKQLTSLRYLVDVNIDKNQKCMKSPSITHCSDKIYEIILFGDFHKAFDNDDPFVILL